MASNDKGAGPQVGQVVLYNNGGTVTAEIIYAVAAAGTVSLVYFTSGGPATSATGVGYDVGPATSKWAYPPFF
jgi:hypothetical protein